MSNLNQLFSFIPLNNNLVAFILIIWSISIKGLGLWKASRNNQKYWFVAILVVNTLGILELVYIKFFQKNLNLTSLQKTTSKSK
jgi:hypothetical protein